MVNVGGFLRISGRRPKCQAGYLCQAYLSICYRSWMHFCDNLQTYVHLWFHYGKLPAGTNACMTATMLMKLNHFLIHQGFSVCESKL